MTELRRYERFFENCDTVVAIVRPSGRNDTKEFLAGLPAQHQSRFEYLLKKLCNKQQLKSPEHRRTIRKRGNDGILVQELKTGKYRLYLAEYQGYWYVTHGQRNLQIVVSHRKLKKR